MDWKHYRRTIETQGKNCSYIIRKNRAGKFFVKAYLMGGREKKLPFQSFDTAAQAQERVEEYENRTPKHKSKPVNF
jgi:hypothetical protein